MIGRDRSVVNFRDIGGLRAPWGAMPRGRFFRCAAPLPTQSSSGFENWLSQTRVRRVVDLREDGELSDESRWVAPDTGLGREVEWVRAGMSQVEWFASNDPGDFAVTLLPQRYLALVTGSRNEVPLREAFNSLFQIEAPPTVTWCMGGKDRTGVVIALFLDSLGVNREQIALDYSRSSGVNYTMMRRFVGAEPSGVAMEPWRAHARSATSVNSAVAGISSRAPRAAITTFLSLVDAKLGGSQLLLRDFGIQPAVVSDMKLVLAKESSSAPGEAK